MQKIRIGMTKNEVVAIMGKSYEVIAHTEKGYTLGYKAYDEGIYHLRFVNNRLKSWKKEWPYYPRFRHQERTEQARKAAIRQTSDNSGTKAHLDAHRRSMLSGADSEAQKNAINFHMDAHEKAVLGN
ncbi:MAG: outer membrane protein assembly factor BamE [Bacteroides sp.]|nr:outer membrane protein assembly factor BamE [Bacteroides sp.]